MFRLQKYAWRLLPGLVVIEGLLIWYPVRTGLVRMAIIMMPVAALACLWIGIWKFKRIRLIPLIPVALLVLLLIAPGTSPDPVQLRRAYVESLMRYEGTRYVWGGEGWRGVDCSGLLRAAFVDACMRESRRQWNTSMLDRACEIWWLDASAAELKNGYRGNTRQLGEAIALQNLPANFLTPGDFAITADGSHALAYLGEGQWIEADPYRLKVIELSPGTPSDWWHVKVIPCRWSQLIVPGDPQRGQGQQ